MQRVRELDVKSTAQTPSAEPSRFVQAAALLLLLVATLLAYSPVMFNFFNGDDFVHLSWLAQAVQHPELVLRNFHTSWLDGTTTRFYRPLISVFMFTDYLTWGVNGLGFRITNLIFHLSSSVFLYLITRELQRRTQSNSTILPAVVAAGLFALYPLHPEAVSWITGRVDSIVTTFCLASLYGFMSWRRGAGWGLPLSAGAMVLGLLSKEMAITIPAVLAAYEFCILVKGRNIFANAVAALRPTILFWGLLGGYFVVRRLALGTFVGGYDNSLLFIANFKEFALSWLHALKMLVIPINKSLLGNHSILVKLWHLLAASAAVSAVVSFVKDSRIRPAFAFALIWLAMSLAPVYKLFAIADDLQGSRLAYLATAPVCLLFGLAFSRFSNNIKLNWLDGVRTTLAVALCSLAGLLLWINNLPWMQSGMETNAIRVQLQKLYNGLDKDAPGSDPQVLFVGLPDQVDGAYTCRNALDGMTRRPQLSRDIKNCLAINPYEPIFPFGYLKDSLSAVRDQVKIFRWDETRKRFDTISIPALRQAALSSWTAEQLLGGASAGTVVMGGKQRAFDLVLPEPIDCWRSEFFKVTLHHNSAPKAYNVNLLYTTQFASEPDLKRRVEGRLPGTSADESLVLSLRGLPDWSLGGQSRKLRLLVPAAADVSLKEVSLVDASTVTPSLSFANSGYLGSKGYLHLSAKEPICSLSVDASGVPGASNWQVEITRVNLLFEEQNTERYSAVCWKKLDGKGLSGTCPLNFADFAGAGIYELRAWALGPDGKARGLSSDHIVVSVD